MKHLLLALVFAAGPALAETPVAQIVISGEIHDNPAHQQGHADLARAIGAKALVFEMLSQAQADLATPDLIGDRERLQTALGWNASGWPDFVAYYPIFAAAPDARIYGAAVPREAARAAFSDGIAATFGPDAAAFGLTEPLPDNEQVLREADQLAAHCNALPAEMLPIMVSIQRLRDASLARAALTALQDTGGPVLVVTGNGHARRDRGIPVYLAKAAPDVTIHVRGQGEFGRLPRGGFDATTLAAPVDRDDPCAAFDQG
ncbi:hypothetical protein ACMU_15060 [Actibacterium mucosum KCTC 23349]|uniref:Haem-binding uptake Tiki superfamily ChaN domain-containing protein n=1 Tax=Actibacterium mucosum KCTC 23349 TaxID=1454373 RepID=A0A037ZG02_9RHOB|nr:ChaN family lipoprotein [Actibacterium mucosum]KAJ55073.1 hypothetical protein ACMU_15060 [Actibacterium mucosum KCTC 23349]